ncbi:MAG: N-formylglutamate amidohydrolase [Deltaproteobacteria bacterium]
MSAEKCCEILGAQRKSRFVLCCDHASNAVPPSVNGGDLGLPPEDMERHIAYDVGAAGLTRALAALLDAPAILSCWSRLVIDPNRADWDPTLVRRIYDGTVIPANRAVDQAEITRRIEAYYRPYHDALAAFLAGRDAVLVSMHSFTPQLRGRSKRPWHVGVLHSPRDDRFSKALIARLVQVSTAPVGDNEPYSGHLPGDTVDSHALDHGRHNTLIEVRNDLITTPEGQQQMADFLAPILVNALKDIT